MEEPIIDAIVSQKPADFASDAEDIAHRFAQQLTRSRRVDQTAYERAAATLGERGVVDMVMLIGLYQTVCAIINAFEIPLPDAVQHSGEGRGYPQAGGVAARG